MRITEGRLMQVTTRGVADSMEKVGKAGAALSSGYRVQRPSDDPTSWIDGMRSKVRLTLSQAHGDAMARGKDRLSEAELRSGEITDILSQARERAVMFANESYSAEARALGAEEIQVLRDRVLSLLNSQGTDGEYIFGGSRSGNPPFSPQGAFQADGNTRVLETPDGGQIPMAVSGIEFTANYGVDVLGTLDAFVAALSTNDIQGIRQSMTDLESAFEQVVSITRRVGARTVSLEDAEQARQDLDVQLQTVFSERMATDPVAAAIDLNTGRSALEGARAAAEQIVDMTRVR
jgi:flagellar hook-associated protein 3 FlgL